MNNVITKVSQAREFAFLVHKEPRKYTGEPYIHHNAEMVGMFYSLMSDKLSARELDIYCSVIWLHDTIEDCGVTKDELIRMFSVDVATGVQWLTDDEVGKNRTERKALARERLGRAPAIIQTIKCLDLWSNAKAIFIHDPGFAPTFAKEVQLLLEQALLKADVVAYALIEDRLKEYKAKHNWVNKVQVGDESSVEDTLKQIAKTIDRVKANGEYAKLSSDLELFDLVALTDVVLIALVRNTYSIRDRLPYWETLMTKVETVLTGRQRNSHHILRGLYQYPTKE